MSLSVLRSRIEKVDEKIVRLLNERMRLAADVGRIKRRQDRSAFAPDREEYLLRLLWKKSRGPLPEVALRAIYREVFSSSRARQEALTIGYLGGLVSGAFHAAWLRFGASESYRPQTGWETMLRGLRTRRIDVGVCPLAVFAESLAIAPLSLGGDLRVCGAVRFPGFPSEKGPKKKAGGRAGSSRTALIRAAAPAYYLISRREEEPKADRTFRSVLLASTGAKPAVLGRWCRSHKAVPLPLRPFSPAARSRFLLETDGAQAPARLEASFREACGEKARLEFLGAFAAPHPYGR